MKEKNRIITTALTLALIGIAIFNGIKIKEQRSVMARASQSWGLGFHENGKAPTANETVEEMKKYNCYYLGDQKQKNIYLTFDCGYDNGYTESILDTLKEKDVPATFFVVGNFLDTRPDLVNRMMADGHHVGNHSYYHPDMSNMSRKSFEEELNTLSDKCKEVTGKECDRYYRPPQGKYSKNSLKLAQNMGYKTIFWSLAYVDWYDDDQPTHEEAFEKLLSRIHPGAIVLLHVTSRTNAEILPELIEQWQDMGYTFGDLDDL